MHMGLLGLLRFREMLVDVLDGDEGPCKVVPLANYSEPGFFGWKTCSSMKVTYLLLDAGQFVDVVDGV